MIVQMMDLSVGLIVDHRHTSSDSTWYSGDS